MSRLRDSHHSRRPLRRCGPPRPLPSRGCGGASAGQAPCAVALPKLKKARTSEATVACASLPAKRASSGVSAYVHPSCAASRRCDCRMYICAPSPPPRWQVVCSTQPAGGAPAGRRQLHPLPGTAADAPSWRSCWRPSGRQVVARRRRAWWPAGSQPMPRGPCDAGDPGCGAATRGIARSLRLQRGEKDGSKHSIREKDSIRTSLQRISAEHGRLSRYSANE